MRKTALIVEPYLSGGLLPEAFARFGVATIGIHLRHEEGRVSQTFLDDQYPDQVFYHGDLAELADRLRSVPVVAVTAGQEAGVELSDALVSHYGVRGNDPLLSRARRDKYLMHQTIAAQGLRAIRQARSAEVAVLKQWAARHNYWPVVIKPVNSGGTDGVRFCHDADEIASAFAEVIGETNLLGFENHELLVQERIRGTEYMVDTVSCDGQHVLVNIARYEKELTGGAPIYRTIDFLDPAEWDGKRPLVEYVFSVLDALGIRNGPAHSEVFETATGHVLVETGARLCGAMVPRYLDEISSRSILDLSVAAIIDPGLFRKLTEGHLKYNCKLLAFVLKTGRTGILRNRPGDALIRGLDSFRDVQWYGKIGGEIIPTRDLLTGLGMVFLRSADPEILRRDLDRLREWETQDRLIDVA